jgi:hypothetical protein
MSFALEPVDYLRMLKEEYGEYRRSSPELIRKAITCCSNGRTELMDDILRQVIASWDVIFPRDAL